MLKQVGLKIITGVALLAVTGVAGAFFVAQATPEREVAVSRTVPTGDKPFAAVCKSGEVLDSRPDPAWVGASFEKDNCRAPVMPARVDGSTASREQVVAGMAALKNFTVASAAFERCVQDFVAARKAEGEKGRRSFVTPLTIIENHRILVSQRNQQLASARVTATINNFNAFGSGCED
jgi:hypothetical protein